MDGKVFGVTGGASGIGLATAKALVEKGAKVSIADLSPDLEDVVIDIAQHAKLEDSVYAHCVDVKHLTQVEAWIDATVKHFGRLDGAANIAGVYDYPTPALWHEERGIEQWDHVIGVNLTGTANCLHAELKFLTEIGGNTSGRRKIVNMTSVAGFRARGGSPAYIASKHGIIGLTKALAKEYGPVSVNINAVAPGAIDTPMNQNVGRELGDKLVAAIPVARRGTAEETAKLVVFLLSDDADYITGATFTVDGGMTV